VLTLCPGLALAYWFAATVFVARQAFDAALDELRRGMRVAGCAKNRDARFKAVGLHLLHGLVLAAQGGDDSALAQFARELDFEADGQLYARECCANTWYSIGAIHRRHGRTQEARFAFKQALARVPDHLLATVALDANAFGERESSAPLDVDGAIALSIVLALQGKHDDAARRCGDALAHAEPGPAGWILPVEPLLNPLNNQASWARTLAMLRDRAA
jgi:tetratricopeptide (TPR) repeat protein